MTAARATRTEDRTSRDSTRPAAGSVPNGSRRRRGSPPWSATSTTIVESAKGGATDDEHDAEGATIAFERAQAMALLEETRIQVEALDTALARVDHGSYGVCESCGQDIAPERLAARPSATLCITCASRRR